jgi:hypothetical protein
MQPLREADGDHNVERHRSKQRLPKHGDGQHAQQKNHQRRELSLWPDEVLSGILYAPVLEVAHDTRWVLFQHRHVCAGCVA